MTISELFPKGSRPKPGQAHREDVSKGDYHGRTIDAESYRCMAGG